MHAPDPACPVGGDARCRLRQHAAGGDPVQLKLNDLDARITRIERIVANQVEAAQHLDEVQSNVRQLRGRLEELEHSNEALAKQQRDLYADLDKRLAAAGGAAAGNASGETAAVGAPRPRRRGRCSRRPTRRPRSSRRCIPRRLMP